MVKTGNAKLNVVYLAQNMRGQENRAQYQRAKYLSEKNQLYLFVWANTRIPTTVEGKAKVTRSRISSRKVLYPLHFGWYVKEALKLGKKTQIDVAYSFYGPFSMIQGFFLKLLGCKWVVDIWDHPNLPFKTSRKRYQPLYKVATYISRKILRRADLIISAILPEALDEYGLERRKIFLVTNGVNLGKTKPQGRTKKDKEFRVFYVGFVRKDRGIGTLLSAGALLKDKISPLRLTLVGDTREEDKHYLQKTIRNLNLEGCVDFRGVLGHEEVLCLEECSDVCIFPFPREKELDCIYPIKVLEYLAMGKAVVATNLKGVRTIIKDGENGLLVEPDDPEEMANAILKIYEDSDLRKKIESNARESVEAYDWDKINESIDMKLKETVKI